MLRYLPAWSALAKPPELPGQSGRRLPSEREAIGACGELVGVHARVGVGEPAREEGIVLQSGDPALPQPDPVGATRSHHAARRPSTPWISGLMALSGRDHRATIDIRSRPALPRCHGRDGPAARAVPRIATGPAGGYGRYDDGS